MRWLDDLFELQAIIALILVVSYCIMIFLGKTPTETFVNMMWVVIGFIFGTNSNKPKGV